MKIGIDARFLNESGVGRYLRNLIENLSILDKKNEYFIFLLPKDLSQFKTYDFHKVEANFPWYGFAEQFNLPKLLKKFKLDLVHFPHFNVPIFYTGKFVVTIHDLIHQHHAMSRATTRSQISFKIKQIGYRRVFKIAVSRSQKILVPSKSVQQLLINEWNVDKGKITVTPEAVDGKILTIAKKMTRTDCKKILNTFKIKQPYLFYVGNAHPHKNLEGLIRVFWEIREKYQNLQLVLAGQDHYFWQRIKKEVDSLPTFSVGPRGNDKGVGNIIFTGFVSDEELVALYKNAKCFVMPSFEEGFGIPLLEAFSCECPVVSSNGGSLPEVGGDAAIYFDPQSKTDMADKIDRVLKSENIRVELIDKGKKRYQLYSFEKLAKQTLEVYLQCG